MAEPTELLRELIAFPTVSASSNTEITDFIESQLKTRGFETERIEYVDAAGVSKSNVVGRLGDGAGGLAWFGHSDVVPADDWSHSDAGPWQAVEADGRLYGRGSCDMKGSLACMLAAVDRRSSAKLNSPIYITVTADEEVGYIGASRVAAESALFEQMVSGDVNGIIGEPTSLNVVYAHKGSIALRCTSRGLAAHSSQSHGVNANLKMIPFLNEMRAIYDEVDGNPHWQNNEFSPPGLSWNIGINDHTHAINITPAQSVCTVYFRPMPGIDPAPLIDRARGAAEVSGLEFEVAFRGEPMYVDPESPFIRELLAVSRQPEAKTVCYGTDGAVLTRLRKLAVFGPGSIEQAHMADEYIELSQLDAGTAAYSDLIAAWCV